MAVASPAAASLALLRAWAARAWAAARSLRLPAASILPVTGALVGLYAGLAASLFSNLIASIQLVTFGAGHLSSFAHGDGWRALSDALGRAPWHAEYVVVGGLGAAVLFTLARYLPAAPGDEAGAETRTRLRVLALLLLGGLALYYPIIALAALDEALGGGAESGLLPLVEASPLFIRPLVPALGGIVVAVILRRAPEARGGGLGQVIRAVSQRLEEGVIPTRVGLIKLVASSVTIGTGGSAGREGPIVQVGGSVGSTVAQALGFTRRDLAVLVGCGSAGGIAASFNAPITGAMFAIEIILREMEVRIFAPIVLASVTATMTAHAVLGQHLARQATYRFESASEVLAYVSLGLLAGLLAVAYERGMARSSAFFEGRERWALSAWLGRQEDTVRCALGGAVVGLVGLGVPQVMGAGLDAVGLAVQGDLPWKVLAAAGLLKIFTTAITLGSGASGGTFFPALFIGAMSGGAFGGALERVFPGATGGAGSYALVGMAACVAGFVRAPLTAILIVFEMTGSYAAILPLMIACTTASALCQAVLGAPHGPASLAAAIPDAHVRLVLETGDPVLKAQTPYSELVTALLRSAHGLLALTDEAGRLTGMVVLKDVQELLREEVPGVLVLAQDVARPARTLPEDLDLRSARDLLLEWELPAAPVVSREDPRKVVGVISVARIHALARAALGEPTGGH